MKKLFILCVSTFMLVFLLVIIFNKNAFAIVFKCRSFNSSSSCFIENVEADVYQNPNKVATTLLQAARLKRIGLIGGDFRAFSLTLHRLGSAFYDKKYSYDTLANHCPALVKDGCIHGYVMQYYAVNGFDQTKNLCESDVSYRLQVGCYHAIGHSYAENTLGNINYYQNTCKQIATGDMYIPCLSGVIHEFSRGSSNSHNHESCYESTPTYAELECNQFESSSVEYFTCYAGIGSFRQYDQNSEDIKHTKELCLMAQNSNAKDVCISMIRERVAISHGYAFIPR